MIDAALAALGARRLLWACDLTMETGLAKLRALEVIGLSADEHGRRSLAQRGAPLSARGTFPRCARRVA